MGFAPVFRITAQKLETNGPILSPATEWSHTTEGILLSMVREEGGTICKQEVKKIFLTHVLWTHACSFFNYSNERYGVCWDGKTGLGLKHLLASPSPMWTYSGLPMVCHCNHLTSPDTDYISDGHAGLLAIWVSSSNECICSGTPCTALPHHFIMVECTFCHWKQPIDP